MTSRTNSISRIVGKQPVFPQSNAADDAQTTRGSHVTGAVLSQGGLSLHTGRPSFSPSASMVVDAGVLAYSLRDAAKLSGLSVSTLRRLIKDKELTAKRIGSRVVVTREAMLAFLSN